jgi:hypothetical protein
VALHGSGGPPSIPFASFPLLPPPSSTLFGTREGEGSGHGQETGGAHFAPEGDSFLSAVANAPPVFFFLVPPLDVHGNQVERARPEAAHFAGDAGKFSFSPLISVLDLGFFWGELGFPFDLFSTEKYLEPRVL